MGDPKGFLKVKRQASDFRPVCERVKDYKEVFQIPSDKKSMEQASRCMDCGTPFCNWGCPVGNYIPEWNDFMFHGHWEKAYRLLDAMNNLPEITGRVCPAACEYACVLGANDDPVTVRENELAIIEYAFKKGFVKHRVSESRTGKRIAVVGSGPAGISSADQLNRYGHSVVVFEKAEKIGGILRYGIPDFKLEKWILDRRINILKKEGIKFITGVNVGIDYGVPKLLKEFDAVCLAGGSRVPRDLKIEGRGLKGIHFAMDYLTQQNKRVSGENFSEDLIDAKGRKVVVIGGGDTGSDCVGTAHRQGANCVVQIEIMPKPEGCRTDDYPWPSYPMILKTSTSHEEGGERYWSLLTKNFTGKNGRVSKIICKKVEFSKADKKGCSLMKEIPDSEFEIDAGLVIIAAGFLHASHGGLVDNLGVEKDERGNVKTNENFMTSIKNVFSAGDMRRGQSLVVWAINEGRRCAEAIDKFLLG